jgi:Asp/Glu/hydantoin racemase
MFNVGLVRVVTMQQQELIDTHGKLLESYFPQLNVESKCIYDQPFGIHDNETEALAIPKIIKMAKAWKGIDALVISCAGDPAVKDLRKVLDIPVVGAGEATALLSMRYSGNVASLGITEEAPTAYHEILKDRLICHAHPEGVTSTIELMQPEGWGKAVKKALELKESGIGVIALSCTGMSTIRIAAHLEKICGIPVIDPVIAEGTILLFECLRRGWRNNE